MNAITKQILNLDKDIISGNYSTEKIDDNDSRTVKILIKSNTTGHVIKVLYNKEEDNINVELENFDRLDNISRDFWNILREKIGRFLYCRHFSPKENII